MPAEDPLQRRHMDELLPLVTVLAVQLRDPLELDCPTLEVDTTNGYQPGIENLAEAILAKFAPHLRALLED